jgi:hypothetical protein
MTNAFARDFATVGLPSRSRCCIHNPQRMLTSRPAPLTASRPLHARTPGKALQKARGILQENALHGPRTAKTLRIQPQTPSKGEFLIAK